VAIDYKNFDAHFYLGEALFCQGEAEAALFEYSQLNQLFPERMEPLNNQGVMLARLNRTDDAIKAFTSAIDIGKKQQAPSTFLLEVHINLAEQQTRKGSHADAAKTYEAALELKPGEVGLGYRRAQSLLLAGKPDEALPFAFELFGADVSNVALALLVADIFDAKGLATRGIRELDRSLAMQKSDDKIKQAALLLRRGLLQGKAGDRAGATSSFVAAAEANPNSWEARYNLGASLLAANPSDAAKQFEAAAKLKPQDAETQLGLAQAYDASGNTAGVATAAKKAAAGLSNATLKNRALFLAGKSAYTLGQYNEATPVLKQLVAADANSFDGQLWLGLSLFQQKDYDGAATALAAASKLNANSLFAASSWGAALVAGKKYSEAATALEPVVKTEPSDRSQMGSYSDALTNYGIALANTDRTEDACAALNKAVKLGSTNAGRVLAAFSDRCKK
jgi:tetratricopeptide (TPR) repeat protein